MFRQDSWLSAALDQIATVVVRNLLWLLSAILVIPAGAGLAAVFYLTILGLEGDEGQVAKRFWHGFKASFLPATTVWLIDLLLVGMVVVEWQLLGSTASGVLLIWLRSLVIIGILIILGTNIWFWALCGRRLAAGQPVRLRELPCLVRDCFLAFIKYLPRTLVGVLAALIPLLGLLFGPVWALRVIFYLAVIGVGIVAQLSVVALRKYLVREIPDDPWEQ